MQINSQTVWSVMHGFGYPHLHIDFLLTPSIAYLICAIKYKANENA